MERLVLMTGLLLALGGSFGLCALSYDSVRTEAALRTTNAGCVS